jgi:signal peptidase I
VTLLIGAVIVPLARVAVAIDAVRTPALRPSWKAVLIACGGLLVVTVLVDLFVAEPLGVYYKTHYAQAFTIPSGAMAPTLLVGDYIITDRSAYRSQLPRRGDIIVFKYPQDERRDFIKRIIGLPGDEILIRERPVFVNGVPLSEPYVMHSKLPSSTRLGAAAYCGYAFGCTPTVVPPNAYFVMGDNRDNSQDSRYWGFVKREKIVGRATTVYWSWDGTTHRLRIDRIGRRL